MGRTAVSHLSTPLVLSSSLASRRVTRQIIPQCCLCLLHGLEQYTYALGWSPSCVLWRVAACAGQVSVTGSLVCTEHLVGGLKHQEGLSYHSCHMTDLTGLQIYLLHSSLAVVALHGTSHTEHAGTSPAYPATCCHILGQFCQDRSYC